MKTRTDPWLRTSATDVALGERTVTIVHPFDADDLISEEDFVRDERLPYWADLWPASRVLSDVLIREESADGKKLLELGCGLGLVSLAATLAGFDVLATDYYADALSFAANNVALNTVDRVELKTLMLNWRELPSELSGFDYVVASDVLYEKEYGALVAEIISRTLAPGGSAIIADPGRIAANEFLYHCDMLGLRLSDHTRVPIEDAGRHQTVDVYRFAKDSAQPL